MKALTKNRTNEEWVTSLKQGDDFEHAIADLRAILVRGLRFTLANRIDSDLNATVEDFVQDALLKILDKLDTFRGESRFTTWAQKVAVRVAISEMRRSRWRDVSLNQLTEKEEGSLFIPIELADKKPLPELQTSQQNLLFLVQRLIDEELTPRQREAMKNLMLPGLPMEEVATRMNTNRNALYKLMHDARLRLKQALLRENLTPEDILATFR